AQILAVMPVKPGGPQKPAELLAPLRRKQHITENFASRLFPNRQRDAFALDSGLKRYARGIERERVFAPKRQAINWLMSKSNSRGDARSRIFAVEFTELPLPGQHPEGVANLRAQAATEVERARARFEAVVGDDSRQSKDRRVDDHLIES